MTVTAAADRCDVEEDLGPPFHHCVPLVLPGGGRRSRRGAGEVAAAVLSTVGGLRPCPGRCVDLADGAGGSGSGGGVQRSNDDAGGLRRWKPSLSSSLSSCSTLSTLLSLLRCGESSVSRRGGAAAATCGGRAGCSRTSATRSDAVR